jgi:hypothetical protein
MQSSVGQNEGTTVNGRWRRRRRVVVCRDMLAAVHYHAVGQNTVLITCSLVKQTRTSLLMK